MTSLQLLLTIGIPSLLVILSWIQSSQRLGRLQTVVDKLGSDLRTDLKTLRDSIHRDMVLLHERVAIVETRQQR